MPMVMNDLVSRLQRRLNDTENEFTNLDGYIEDAIGELSYLFLDLEVTNGELSREVTNSEATIITIQAHILVETGLKSSSNRNNFRIKKENISIDNTQQSRDHGSTLNLLHEELDRAIHRHIVGDIEGIRVE